MLAASWRDSTLSILRFRRASDILDRLWIEVGQVRRLRFLEGEQEEKISFHYLHRSRFVLILNGLHMIERILLQGF